MVCSEENNLNLENIQNDISKVLQNFNLSSLPTDPNELSNLIPDLSNLPIPNFNENGLPEFSNMPEVNSIITETQALFKEKCAKESGSDAAYEEAVVRFENKLDFIKN